MVDAAPAPMTPPPPPPPAPFDAREAVRIPATLLMVLSGLGVFGSLASIVWNLLSMGQGVSTSEASGTAMVVWGTLGIICAVVSLAVDGFVLFGALQMKNLKNYTMALIAGIIAIVPCFWSCFCIGIPIGIWAVVVLMKPEVKAAFQSSQAPH